MPQTNGNRKNKSASQNRGASQNRSASQNGSQVSKSNEELRREHRAARRRSQRMRRRIFYAALILVVVIVGIVLSLTVFFNITKIEVEGNSIYTEKEIIAASGIDVGDNLFLVSRNSARTSILEKLPFAGSAEFSNKLPGTIKIKVNDTAVKCAIETDDGYVLINEDGKVLGSVKTLEELYENSVKIGEYKDLAKGSSEDKDDNAKEGTSNAVDGTVKNEENVTKTAESTAKSEDGATKTDDSTAKSEESTANGEKVAQTAEAVAENTAFGAKYVLSSDELIILKGIEIDSAVPGQVLAVKKEKTMELYQEIMASLETNDIDGINEINLADSFSVTLMYQDRIEILLGSVSNLNNKLALCKEILKKQDDISPYQKGTVDLTIDKKAYFSPYSEQSAVSQEAETTDPVSAAVTEKVGEKLTDKVTEKVTGKSTGKVTEKVS